MNMPAKQSNARLHLHSHFYRFIYKFKQTKVFTRLPNRILSTSSCVSGKACVIICEISLFVTAANPEAILLATVCVARSEALAGE